LKIPATIVRRLCGIDQLRDLKGYYAASEMMDGKIAQEKKDRRRQ
jgi:hypothetical protein